MKNDKIDHTGFCMCSYDKVKCFGCPTERECLDLYKTEQQADQAEVSDMKKVYLICPYSDEFAARRGLRFDKANQAAMYLMKKGYIVFSPISHSHPISLPEGNSLDHDFWLKQDRAFVEWADFGVVLCLYGWRESKGVNLERGWFEEMGKPIMHLYHHTPGGFIIGPTWK